MTEWRFRRPEEVADLVAFLASDSAGYITAQDISIDGGMGLNTFFVGPARPQDRGSSQIYPVESKGQTPCPSTSATARQDC
ncbi:SDR family oxidoreductase [Mycobacterium intracellulare]|uniref:SDR family oxidoreductase n=1 Tax=Mycobacterium intracellulare subsp. chimaera TaxID=222805 RepID=A0ABT7P7R1_MYCIT|nr:SDR family oxidoreductase [Mycobacterium intracellulare]MDM3905911.1 SDR family oxidoreductase [Mycobacterium intracellulare subsp. chimaera]MDM3929058.1 SDR family oxidoreductase [Mycobacterium intracellulare subsp. chimaera]MDM3932565.1 SDR family oxidoreductase [Mycobacterium intracellulare subsp. chimaera]